MKHFFEIIIVCFFTVVSAQQKSFSVEELTGKGKLSLAGKQHKLQTEAYQAFSNMQMAAKKEGISIQMVSGFRDYKHQNKIWNKKYDAFVSSGMSPQKAIEKIVEYSTIPGTSRHHWGTDIDIIDVAVKTPKKHLLEDNYIGDGVYSKLKKWMDENAEKFGFYLVYTNNFSRKGFRYEPWHYSYKPISKVMYKDFLKIDFITLIKNENLKGGEYLTEDFLKLYYKNNIKDINGKLKP